LKDIQREQESLPKLIPSLQTHQRIGMHGLPSSSTKQAWVTIDFGKRATPERIAIFPARLPADIGAPSPGFPGALEIDLADDAAFTASKPFARWTEPAPQAGEQLPFILFAGNGAAGRYLRVRIASLRLEPRVSGDAYFRLGEIVVLENGCNVALGSPVASSGSTESARRWERRNITDGNFWCIPFEGAEASPTHGFQSAVSRHPVVSGAAWVEVALDAAQPIDQICLVPAHPRDFADSAGFGFPTHFQVIADPGTAREKIVLRELEPVHPAEALPNPGAAPLMIATPGFSARRIRVVCETLWRRGPSSGSDPSEFVFALSELQVLSGGKNLAAGRLARSSNTTAEPGWSPAALTDGYSSRHKLLDWEAWLSGIERSEALRVEAAAIRLELETLRETRQRWTMLAAVAAVAVSALLAAVGMLVLRSKAQRARDELRTRIARDLHDEIGASLSHLAIQSDMARQQLARGELKPERLSGISETARDTLDNMRDIVWLLNPRAGSWRDLSLRMESISRRLLDGVEHSIRIEGSPPDGQPRIQGAREAVAFLKEALTNARRHSGAQHVTVTLEWGATLLLKIKDDGKGFDVDAARMNGGAGLDNLNRRALALGAHLRIESAPGQGSLVELSVPLKNAPAGQNESP